MLGDSAPHGEDLRAPERVLITGTTSGLGRALLEHYVHCGSRVVAVNRRQVPELRVLFPSVHFACVDVRDAQAVFDLIEQLNAAGELPELLLLNAGINRVDNDEVFDIFTYKSVLDTNLHGVLHFVTPLLRLPARRGPRHVVAISSLAALVGNPYGLGYHTSKRALSACFATWSNMYAGTDLVFQQVLLGPVRTPMYTMAEHFPRWMVRVRDTFSGSLEGAVEAIAHFALSRRKRLIYPGRAVPLFAAMGLGQALIPGFFQGRKTLGGTARRSATGQR